MTDQSNEQLPEIPPNPAVTLDLCKADISKPEVHFVNGVPLVLMPPDWQAEYKTDLAETRFVQREPYIRHSIYLSDGPSFMDYVERFRTDEDCVFIARRDLSCVEARFNFHRKGSAGFDSHIAIRKFKIDKRFDEWRQFAGGWKSQEQLIEFLEDRTGDLDQSEAAPLTQSQLLTLVANFRATQSLNCVSAVNRRTGDVEIVFQKNTTERMDVTLPEKLLLLLPVYEFGAAYQIHARFRFKLNDNKVQFRIDMVRVENLIETAFLDELNDLEATLEQKVLLTP